MATVAEFMRAGTSLLQIVVGNDAGSADLGHWIEQFQDFVTKLDHGATVDTTVGVTSLEKACWKISQDILIRLRRMRVLRKTPAPEGNDINGDLRSAFTEQDVESLRTQLFGIQMRWQSIGPEVEAPL